MNRNRLPAPGLLDYLSRQDELLVRLIEAVRKLNNGLEFIVPVGGDVSKQELRQQVESNQYIPYAVKTYSLGSAREDEPIDIEGDFIHAWTDGTLSTIGIRLGHPNNDLYYFNRHNPVRGFPFWKIYLTNDAQASKTLSLLVGKGSAVTAGNIGVDIIAQTISNLSVDLVAQTIGNMAINIAAQAVNVSGLREYEVQQGNEKSWSVSASMAGNTWKDFINYTVPAGKTLYVYKTTVLIDDSTETSKYQVRNDGSVVWRQINLLADTEDEKQYEIPLAFDAGEEFDINVYKSGVATRTAYVQALAVEK